MTVTLHRRLLRKPCLPVWAAACFAVVYTISTVLAFDPALAVVIGLVGAAFAVRGPSS